MSFSEYSLGLLSANCTTSYIPISAVTDTITIGNTSRIPNTAMSIPTVKKIVFQNLSQFFKTDALTTALSKDKDISINAKTSVTNRAENIAVTPPCVYPQYAAAIKAAVVKTISK